MKREDFFLRDQLEFGQKLEKFVAEFRRSFLEKRHKILGAHETC